MTAPGIMISEEPTRDPDTGEVCWNIHLHCMPPDFQADHFLRFFQFFLTSYINGEFHASSGNHPVH